MEQDVTHITPNGTTIAATTADGRTVDVTESIAAIYDLVIQSMDFGSGFLTIEEAIPLAVLGRVCGFEQNSEAERYLQAQVERVDADVKRWDDPPVDERLRQRRLAADTLGI